MLSGSLWITALSSMFQAEAVLVAFPKASVLVARNQKRLNIKTLVRKSQKHRN